MKTRAFTLIELLVVVLIIGILAAIAVPQYQKSILKVRTTEGLNIVRALKEANERYFLANNEYTKNFEDLDINIGTDWEYKGNETWNSYCYPSCESQEKYIDLSMKNCTFGLKLKDVDFEIMYYYDNIDGSKKGNLICFYGQSEIPFYTQICNSLGFNKKSGNFWLYGN